MDEDCLWLFTCMDLWQGFHFWWLRIPAQGVGPAGAANDGRGQAGWFVLWPWFPVSYWVLLSPRFYFFHHWIAKRCLLISHPLLSPKWSLPNGVNCILCVLPPLPTVLRTSRTLPGWFLSLGSWGSFRSVCGKDFYPPKSLFSFSIPASAKAYERIRKASFSQ